MADLKKLEFFLLRYVPNAVREEFVNIGLVMTETGGDGGGFADVHFTQDWRRARCLHPDIDVEMLDALGREIKNQIASVQERALLLHQMADRYSNLVQLSPVRQCLAEDPALEMENLATTLVEMPRTPMALQVGAPGRRAGRRWIHSEMTNGFEVEGVLSFLDKNIAVSPYTNETDKFTFDFAYSFGLNGETTRVFQALSLTDRSKDTEMFPFRVAKIGPRLAQLKKTEPIFTAVVEDNYDPADAYVTSILAFMKDENIRVSPLREMPAIARTARLELRV